MRPRLLLAKLVLLPILVLASVLSHGAAQASRALTVTDLIAAIKIYHPVIQSAKARREQTDTE